MSMASPSSVMAAPCHLPPGEGFLFLTPGAGAGADIIRPESPCFAVALDQPPLSKGGGTGAARDGRIPFPGKLS